MKPHADPPSLFFARPGRPIARSGSSRSVRALGFLLNVLALATLGATVSGVAEARPLGERDAADGGIRRGC